MQATHNKKQLKYSYYTTNQHAIIHMPLHMHHQPTAWTPSQIVYIRNLVCAEINIWSLPSAAALSELSVSQIVAVYKLAPLCTNVPNDPKAQWS